MQQSTSAFRMAWPQIEPFTPAFEIHEIEQVHVFFLVRNIGLKPGWNFKSRYFVTTSGGKCLHHVICYHVRRKVSKPGTLLLCQEERVCTNTILIDDIQLQSTNSLTNSQHACHLPVDSLSIQCPSWFSAWFVFTSATNCLYGTRIGQFDVLTSWRMYFNILLKIYTTQNIFKKSLSVHNIPSHN